MHLQRNGNVRDIVHPHVAAPFSRHVSTVRAVLCTPLFEISSSNSNMSRPRVVGTDGGTLLAPTSLGS
ncbi:hypothetical protein VTO73DRAFT_2619 [Trametes versicolor]